MAFTGYLQFGATELANSTRTVTYLQNGVRNTSLEVGTDDSWPLLPWLLGRDGEYTLPHLDDDCPWRDPVEPASAEFAGVWPMQITGLDADPVTREVIEAASDGGGVGPLRIPPRTVTVEALLLAKTPAGLQYGKGWLNSVLLQHEPQRLTFLASAPAVDGRMGQEHVMAVGMDEMRMLSSVSLTGQVEVEEDFSPWVEENRGATAARVSFELTAGVPWVWRLPQPLAEGLRPYEGERQSVVFDNGQPPEVEEVVGGVLHDPETSPAVVLPRPVTPAAALGLYPLESKRLPWVLAAGTLSRWFDTLPTVTVRTGPQVERAVRLQWVPGLVRDLGEDLSRRAVGEALVRYLPANSTLSLDAVTGRATVVTEEGRVLDATPVTTGRSGGPWRAPVLRPDETYTLVIDTEDTVHPDVAVQVDAMVRGH